LRAARAQPVRTKRLVNPNHPHVRLFVGALLHKPTTVHRSRGKAG
jgi:hypothetical protein